MVLLLSSVMVYCLTMGVVNSWQSGRYAKLAAGFDYLAAAGALCFLYYRTL